MTGILRVAGIFGIVAGGLALLISLAGAFTATVPGAWANVYISLGSVVSGAVLYCFGQIVDLLELAVEHLKAIRDAAGGAGTNAPDRTAVTPSAGRAWRYIMDKDA